MFRSRYKKTGNRDIDVIIDAICEIDERHYNDRESRLALIHELVLSSRYCSLDSKEAFEFIRRFSVDDDFRSTLSSLELVALCREYLSLFPESKELNRNFYFGISTEPYAEDAVGKLEFIGNKYTDEACKRFSEHIKSARPFGVTNFEELCEDVSSGRCEYGILPVESTDNGKLLRFYTLINRYELKISAVCSVESSDRENTGFALVKRSIDFPESAFGAPDMVELFVRLGDNESLSEILTAADFCNMELYRIDSLPFSYIDAKFTLCPVFKLESKSDIRSFLLYMSIAFPQFTPIGIFRYLN